MTLSKWMMIAMSLFSGIGWGLAGVTRGKLHQARQLLALRTVQAASAFQQLGWQFERDYDKEARTR